MHTRDIIKSSRSLGTCSIILGHLMHAECDFFTDDALLPVILISQRVSVISMQNIMAISVNPELDILTPLVNGIEDEARLCVQSGYAMYGNAILKFVDQVAKPMAFPKSYGN